jgi:hypothetical protein
MLLLFVLAWGILGFVAASSGNSTGWPARLDR